MTSEAAEIPQLARTTHQLYEYWRIRVLYSTIIGYATFYLVRTNVSVAIPVMEKNLHLSKTSLGTILSIGGVVYGVSKFFNGFVGDRVNARYFMALGLFCSAMMNFAFGLSSGLMTLAIFWLANGWFQGMGFPPCARSMAHWFAPSERGVTMGVWNIGHQIGAALSTVIAGYVVVYNWRYVFIVPALIALVGTLFILERLRDTPASLGLPPIESYRGAAAPVSTVSDPATDNSVLNYATPGYEELTHKQVVYRYVLTNKYMWLISLANFFVYTLRYAALSWAPSFLSQMKGMTLVGAGWLSAGSEIAGLAGSIVAGFVTDYVFGGKAGRVSLIAMLAMTCAVTAFLKVPGDRTALVITCYLAMGFLVYVPQMLIGVMAMNLATKRAAATAVGMTGFFGYASTLVSGWGVGMLADHYGWNAAFGMLIGCTIVTAVLFAFTWNVGPARER